MDNILIKYGLDKIGKEKSSNEIGRVIEVDRKYYKLATIYGIVNAKVKGSWYHSRGKSGLPTVGDWVYYSHLKDNDFQIIEEVVQRKNWISRNISKKKTDEEQILASNIDCVFVCASVNNDFNLNKLERYVFAFQDNNKVVIILTKSDLVDHPEYFVNKVKERIRNVDVIFTSNKNKESLILLKNRFKTGDTYVFVGSSGVGKSSLINAIYGEDIQKIANINDKNEKGRHTTTSRQLVCSKDYGCLIDTPGIRSVGIWESGGENSLFVEIKDLKNHCKYNDCSHIHESGCAVLRGLKNGLINEEEYKNYIKLYNELQYINDVKQHNQKEKKRIKKIENEKQKKRNNRKRLYY